MDINIRKANKRESMIKQFFKLNSNIKNYYQFTKSHSLGVRKTLVRQITELSIDMFEFCHNRCITLLNFYSSMQKSTNYQN